MAPTADPSSWKLCVEADGALTTWNVCSSAEEARLAAGVGTTFPAEEDKRTGFLHFKVKAIRQGKLSLDDIEESTEEHTFTWSEELKKAGLLNLKLAPGQGAVRVKAHSSEGGRLVWDEPSGVTLQEPEEGSAFKPPPREGASAKAKARQSQKGKVRATSVKAKAKEEVKGLWGKTFKVPGQKIGAGSYHFLADKSAYLNYEKIPPHWKLSDGSGYPPRLDFEKILYNEEERNFKGTINWPVSSKARWEYDLYFDVGFIGISGTCKMYRVDAKPDAEPYCVIRFGRDAKYVIETATEAQIEWYYETYDMSRETQRIISIMGEVVEKDMKARQAAGRGKPDAGESLGLIFGQSMQIYARDKKADAMMGESFPMRTGAKLGNPTRWDRTARG